MKKIITLLILMCSFNIMAISPKDTTKILIHKQIDFSEQIFQHIYFGFVYKNFDSLLKYCDMSTEFVIVRGENYDSKCMLADSAIAQLNNIFGNLMYSSFRCVTGITEYGDFTIYVRIRIFEHNDDYVAHAFFVIDRFRTVKMIIIE